jgi:hypothetical protein
MKHAALQRGAMPPISAAADFLRGIAFFLPALSYRPFPLEGFDVCRTLTSPGLEPGFFLCQCSKVVESF